MNEERSANVEFALEEGVEELRQAYDQLLAKDRHKLKYIENIAMDLRLPLTNINLYLKLLQEGHPEKKEHYLGILKEQVAKMSEVVMGMVEFSETEELPPQKLNGVVKSADKEKRKKQSERLAIF